MPDKESTQTAGTTSQDGGDAAAQSQTAGTLEDAGRDAGGLTPEQELAKLREERNLWLQNKSKVEEANALKERVEALQRERDELAARPQPTYAAVDPRVTQQQQAMAELQDAIQTAQWNAQQGDVNAKLLVSLLQSQYQQQQYVMQQLQLQNIPSDERAAVEKKFATGKFTDMQSAHEAVLGERYKTEAERLRKREKEIEEQAAARSKGVVGTGTPIPVTARELEGGAGKPITGAEFAKEHERIFKTEGPEAARAYAGKVRRGEIQVHG